MTFDNDYQALVKKVDEKTVEIFEKQKNQINCRKGCHSCCLPEISVSRIEASAIKKFVLGNAEVFTTAKKLQSDNPHAGRRCQFLEANGSCVIYSARPIICRTHGLPVRLKDKDKIVESSCHLNFKDGLEHIQQDSWINLDLLNSLIALINAKYFPGDQSRSLLNLESILEFDNKPY